MGPRREAHVKLGQDIRKIKDLRCITVRQIAQEASVGRTERDADLVFNLINHGTCSDELETKMTAWLKRQRK